MYSIPRPHTYNEVIEIVANKYNVSARYKFRSEKIDWVNKKEKYNLNFIYNSLSNRRKPFYTMPK